MPQSPHEVAPVHARGSSLSGRRSPIAVAAGAGSGGLGTIPPETADARPGSWSRFWRRSPRAACTAPDDPVRSTWRRRSRRCEEIGATPVSIDFTYYGTREIALVKDGYRTVPVYRKIPTPWYQIFPLEFVTDNFAFTGINDHRI